ncbi:MAG: helix-turn-helix domain-containing protein [Chitinophagaceae bacterium]|jgi:AraC-like DNA-binding protein|nr:helix-turn-helix domain-containing protein [Chitinophagaceae bacterium]
MFFAAYLRMSYFFITGISIALFLTAILLTKEKKSTSDFILAALLFFAAQTIFNTFLVETGLYLTYPDLLVLGFSSPIIVSIFLYLYSKYQTNNIPFQWRELWHFVPAAIIFLIYTRFFFLNPSQKLAVMQSGGDGYEFENLLRIAAIYISGIIYCILSLRILFTYRRNIKNEFSNTEKIEFNWLVFLIIGMLAIWLIILFLQDNKIISISATIFVILLGYFGVTQVNVFGPKAISSSNVIFVNNKKEDNNEPDKPPRQEKYHYSNLSSEESLQIHGQLLKILEGEKPFLNPELTLAELAKHIPTHPNKLSEVINKYEQKSFYDLINERRIHEFFRLLNMPESKQYTLMSLAYDCGFNSKASFNRNFKKYTGKTPSEYQNNQK